MLKENLLKQCRCKCEQSNLFSQDLECTCAQIVKRSDLKFKNKLSLFFFIFMLVIDIEYKKTHFEIGRNWRLTMATSSM